MRVGDGEGGPARVTALPTWVVNQASAHASRLLAEGLAALGARGYHYRVLATLADHGPASQADLGRRSGIHVSDIVATTNELAADGYVERAPDPADRRRNVVTITPTGRRRLRALDKRIAQVQEELLAPLSAQERDQLVTLLRRVNAHQAQPLRRLP